MAHGDLAIPLLHLGAEVVVELFVDLVYVLDLVEDGLDLLNGQHRLGGGSCGLQGFHGLGQRKKKLGEVKGKETRALADPGHWLALPIA